MIPAKVLERNRINELRERSAELKALREARGPAPKKQAEDATQWLADVLSVVRRINKLVFTLQEVYEYADEMEKKHPGCADVTAALRHNLQLLRDQRVLCFLDRGTYQNLELEKHHAR